MRWNTNDVSFRRGNYRPVVFTVDNRNNLYELDAMQTTQSAKANIKKFAESIGANEITVRYFEENDDTIIVGRRNSEWKEWKE